MHGVVYAPCSYERRVVQYLASDSIVTADNRRRTRNAVCSISGPSGGEVVMADGLLDLKLAARFLRVSVRTLERHRCAGTGPLFAPIGRLIRYRQSDLDDWVRNSLRASTSKQNLVQSLLPVINDETEFEKRNGGTLRKQIAS